MSRHRWLAPERLTPAGVTQPTFSADVWSFGLLCLEVFTDADPYCTYGDFYLPVLLSNKTPPEHPGTAAVGLSSKMWELMQSCWADPAARPNMLDIQRAIRDMLPRAEPRPPPIVVARRPSTSPGVEPSPPPTVVARRPSTSSGVEPSPPPTVVTGRISPSPCVEPHPPPIVVAHRPTTSPAQNQPSLPTLVSPRISSGSSHETSRSSSESSSVPVPLTPPPINGGGLQLTLEPSPTLGRLTELDTAGTSRKGSIASSLKSLKSLRMPTLLEDEQDSRNPGISTPLSAPPQLSRSTSQPSTAPSSSPRPSMASDLQGHTNLRSSPSRNSTSTSESTRPKRKFTQLFSKGPKRSQTTTSENGDPVTATVKPSKPKPSPRIARSQTTSAVTPNVVPSRSATILPTLTPNRQCVPVSDGVLEFLRRAASDPESLLRPAKDGTVSAGNLEGLLSRAIVGSADPIRDERFRAALLTIYQVFATSERFFEILKRRFEATSLDLTTAGSPYK